MKIAFSKKSSDHSGENFCFTIIIFVHIFYLVNFFVRSTLLPLYLVTEKFFSDFTNPLWHRIKKWYYKTLIPMHVPTWKSMFRRWGILWVSQLPLQRPVWLYVDGILEFSVWNISNRYFSYLIKYEFVYEDDLWKFWMTVNASLSLFLTISTSSSPLSGFFDESKTLLTKLWKESIFVPVLKIAWNIY